MPDDRDLLNKPEWINKRRVLRFIWASMFFIAGVLAGIGNLLFWLWSPEIPFRKRLLGFASFLIIITSLVCLGIWYAYRN